MTSAAWASDINELIVRVRLYSASEYSTSSSCDGLSHLLSMPYAAFIRLCYE